MQEYLLTIGLLLFFSIIGGIISEKFKQPAVLGLLLIGLVIGPNMLNIVNNKEMIDVVVEFGAILFLFVIGMEFSLKELMKLGGKSLLLAMLKVGIMFFIGFILVFLLGFNIATAIFVGVMISFSSTMIITNVLKHKGLAKRKEMKLIIAILILEDIFGVIVLVFFGAMKNSLNQGLVSAIFNIMLGMLAIAIIYVLLSRFAESIMTWVRKNAGDEIIGLAGLLLCSGMAFLGFYLGLGPGIGAFLAGSIISTFRESKEYGIAIKPHSIMFTSFFFISMGMLVNLKSIMDNLLLITVLIITSIVGLKIAMGTVTRIFGGFSKGSSIFASFAMLPPGLFSLLVAKESASFGVGADLVSVVSVMIIMLTIILAVFIKSPDKYDSKQKNKNILDHLSNYISEFSTEITVQSSQSKALKNSLQKLKWFIIGFAFIFVLSLNFVFKQLTVLNILFAVVCSLVTVYLGFMIYKESQKSFNSAVKILSLIQGGIKIKRANNFLKYLIIGISVLIMGLFSPLLLFWVSLEGYWVIAPVILVIIGLFFAIKSAKYIKNISFEYKHKVHEFKKADKSPSKI